MGKRTTEEYLDKDAALHYLQSHPEATLYGHPDGPGRVYTFRFANDRVEFRHLGGWSVARTVWDRAVKFSEQKLYRGHTTSAGKVRLKRELHGGKRRHPRGIVTIENNSPEGAESAMSQKLAIAKSLIESIGKLLG